MSELEWLNQDWMFASMDRQKFIDDFVSYFNKRRSDKITDVKDLDNGRIVQFTNYICSVQVFFKPSIESVVISHKFHSGERIRQFAVENDLSGSFREIF